LVRDGDELRGRRRSVSAPFVAANKADAHASVPISAKKLSSVAPERPRRGRAQRVTAALAAQHARGDRVQFAFDGGMQVSRGGRAA
jgi:hypothetical protein